MKVLVASNIAKEAVEKMRNEGIEVDVRAGISEEELEEIIENYDALIVRSSPRVTKKVIEKGKRLKIIGRAGVGIDNIDVGTATQRGIIVVNAPGGNTISTAELTMGMIIAAARKIPQADKSVKAGKWERKKFVGVELRGKTLGIIGLGRIGYEVAKRAKAFDMNVIAYDPYISEDRAKEISVKLVPFENLIENSDIITVHVPKTKETENLISEKEFERMKNGVIVINCARGGIINEEALIKAIKSGKVYAAALDVYSKEPPANNELLKLDNVITTPHIGASTKEAQKNVGLIIAEDIINVYHGYPVKNAVNLPSLKPEDFEYLLPYLKLAESMGKIAAARLEGSFEKVKIMCRGKLASKNTDYLSRAVLKGLLEYILGPNINLVSSIAIAEERGIEIEESKSERTDIYESIIEVEVKGRKKDIYLAGTSFGKDDYRIIKIDKYKVDFVPRGHCIISLHEDKPGVIGRVGTLFGKNNINIAGMIVGRYSDKPGGIQLMFLLVDDPPTEKVLNDMIKLDGIIDATYIHL